MSSSLNLDGAFKVESENCKYSDDAIVSDYTWVPEHYRIFRMNLIWGVLLGVCRIRLESSLCASFVPRYETTIVEGTVVRPVRTKMQFKTERTVPKVCANSPILVFACTRFFFNWALQNWQFVFFLSCSRPSLALCSLDLGGTTEGTQVFRTWYFVLATHFFLGNSVQLVRHRLSFFVASSCFFPFTLSHCFIFVRIL